MLREKFKVHVKFNSRKSLPAGKKPLYSIREFSLRRWDLYFTSDEDIKEGDKVINETNQLITIKDKAHTVAYNNLKNGRKVVATTNPEFWQKHNGNLVWDSGVKDFIEKCGPATLVATVATFSDLFTLDIGRQLTTKDIVYVQATNLYYSLQPACNKIIPKIPLDFVEAFVKEKGIWEVQLEVEKGKYYEYSDGTGGTSGGFHSDTLKLNSRGAVIVHKVKEKLYTRLELLTRLAWVLRSKPSEYELEEWLDKIELSSIGTLNI